MPVDARFVLLASMEHFTTQLEIGHLSEGQAAATRLLFENARLRWAYLEMQDAAANGRAPKGLSPTFTLPPTPSMSTAPSATPPAARSLSSHAEALRPLLASLRRLPASDRGGPGPSPSGPGQQPRGRA
jgi:hypothetical protein